MRYYDTVEMPARLGLLVAAACLTPFAFGDISTTKRSFDQVFLDNSDSVIDFSCTRAYGELIKSRFEFPEIARKDSVELALDFSLFGSMSHAKVDLIVPDSVRIVRGVRSEQISGKPEMMYRASWKLDLSSAQDCQISARIYSEFPGGFDERTVTLYADTSGRSARLSLIDPASIRASIPQAGQPNWLEATEMPPTDNEFDWLHTRTFPRPDSGASWLAGSNAGFGLPRFPNTVGTGGFGTRSFAPNYTISGTLYTWDGAGGWEAVPHCQILLWDWKNGAWQLLANVDTNSSGQYSLTYDYAQAGQQDLRLATTSQGPYTNVINPSTLNVYYMDRSISTAPGSRTENLYLNDGMNGATPEGAWKLVGDMSRARDVSVNQFGFSDVPKIPVRWPDSASNFNPTSNPYIRMSSWDADDPTQHEYGHYQHFKAYGNTLPYGSGGWHSFNQQTSRPTAFTEAYATFFMCVAQNQQKYVFPGGSFVDLSTPSNTYLYGIENEAAVCGAMLDIWDSTMPYTNQHWVFAVMKYAKPGDWKAFYDNWVGWNWPYQSQLNANFSSHGMNVPSFNPY